MNIAIISYWHVHAEGYTKEIIEKTNSKVCAIWDEDKTRGEKYAENFSVKFYEDYDELLRNDEIQGVVINSATNKHTELIIKAIKAGKKVFSEKVLALTNAECLQIGKALEENNGELTLSLVKKCNSQFIFAKNLIDSGQLGQITYARVRNVHNGSIGNWLPDHFYNKEQCGGGAMIDLGAHPMYLLNWFLGSPKYVQSVFTDVTGHGVEDNAVSVIEFEKGVIGIAETGFVSVYTPTILEVSGTKGTLIIKDQVTYATVDTNGEWVTVEELPEEQPSPIIQWANEDFINKDEFGIEASIMLTRMVEAAYKSHLTGEKAEV